VLFAEDKKAKKHYTFLKKGVIIKAGKHQHTTKEGA